MKTEKNKIKVSEAIETLKPYPPGKPIEELERELGISGSIKLASNENPIGPSGKAVAAVTSALFNLHRYPDGSCFYLKQRLAKFHNVSEDMIIVGNGSNEIIELLIRTFVGEGEVILAGDPSFAVYPIIAKAAGRETKLVPLKDLTIDLPAMLEQITPKTRLVFIANPNNPTGTIVGAKELEDFLDALPKDVIVCMDEAYAEFVKSPDYPDSFEYLKQGRTLIVLRTFSKIYGLAGLRVGYGVADASLINYMERVRQPFNVNSLAQVAALSALDDKLHVELSIKNNTEGLEYLYSELDKLSLEYVPTEANFFLIKVGDGKMIYDGLLKKGVIVRPMAGYGLGEYIRINVGTPEENKRFIETLQSVLIKQ
ncbi:MAG: histidinol-phosphate transaminase [Deltaproteobacteria bacterium]|nr:histidinol-phosphate transaminase [Deltaproteobacteria bacterium]